MRKKIAISSAALLGVAAIGFFLLSGAKDSKEETLPKVKAVRGTITEKALAVGTIEPENEISVKSKISGVVKVIYADVGAYVQAGQPLLEVKPDPTPLELADAKRQVQIAEVEYEKLLREKERADALYKQALISAQEYENVLKRFEQAELQMKMARERLALIESGRIKIGDTQIESIVKAPISGYVLTRTVEVGDPVTPLSSYQEGTVLMKMANMERLLFKGTVDEIDVGKMKEGMPAEVKVGALPADTVHGSLRKIWLKAEKKDNATVFPIEILIPASSKSTLRAGYSANANIIIQRKTNVLFIPERVVTFKHDSAFVKLAAAAGGETERYIKTGLSDAINIEVKEGLKEGEEVFEKPVKKIE